MQSRRVWLPVVAGVTPVSELAATRGAALAHPGGPPPSTERPVVLVGPEGGWSDGERAAAKGPFVRISRSVLRSETAAIAAGILLTGLRESVVSSIPRREARS